VDDRRHELTIIGAGPIPPYPPAPPRNGTPTKDDGGIELTRSKIEKLSLQDLYPPTPAARERDSGERTMGVVSMVMDHRAADDDVGQ
jgi:hypothetical protein